MGFISAFGDFVSTFNPFTEGTKTVDPFVFAKTLSDLEGHIPQIKIVQGEVQRDEPFQYFTDEGVFYDEGEFTQYLHENRIAVSLSDGSFLYGRENKLLPCDNLNTLYDAIRTDEGQLWGINRPGEVTQFIHAKKGWFGDFDYQPLTGNDLIEHALTMKAIPAESRTPSEKRTPSGPIPTSPPADRSDFVGDMIDLEFRPRGLFSSSETLNLTFSGLPDFTTLTYNFFNTRGSVPRTNPSSLDALGNRVCWGRGSLVGCVDFDDPDNPTETPSVDMQDINTRRVRLFEGHLYAATETGVSVANFEVDPPTFVRRYPMTEPTDLALRSDGGTTTMYVADSASGMRVYSGTTPDALVQVGSNPGTVTRLALDFPVLWETTSATTIARYNVSTDTPSLIGSDSSAPASHLVLRGNTLHTGSLDFIRTYNADPLTGLTLLTALDTNEGTIAQLARDGDFLFTSHFGTGQPIRIWDVSNRTQIIPETSIPASDSVPCIAIRPNRLFVADAGLLRLDAINDFQVNGTVGPEDRGTDTVTITATDSSGEQAETSFTWDRPNRLPEIEDGPLPDQTLEVGQSFAASVPLTRYSDPDQDALAIVPFGSNWVVWNSTSRQISGQPTDSGNFTIGLEINDGHGGVVQDAFRVFVPSDALSTTSMPGGGGQLSIAPSSTLNGGAIAAIVIALTCAVFCLCAAGIGIVFRAWRRRNEALLHPFREGSSFELTVSNAQVSGKPLDQEGQYLIPERMTKEWQQDIFVRTGHEFNQERANRTNQSRSKENQVPTWIGKGQYGDVMAGYRPSEQEWVAVKKVVGAENTKASTEEATLQKQASGEGILPIYNTLGNEDILYHITPLARYDGDQLGERLKSASTQQRNEILTIVTYHLLRGLKTLQEKDIAHLDIKPANFLITKDGKALITDFGTAVADTKGIDWPKKVGDYRYFSWKRLQAKALQQGSCEASEEDKYQVGFSLLTLLTGRSTTNILGFDDLNLRSIGAIRLAIQNYQEHYTSRFNDLQEFKSLKEGSIAWVIAGLLGHDHDLGVEEALTSKCFVTMPKANTWQEKFDALPERTAISEEELIGHYEIGETKEEEPVAAFYHV